MEFDRAFFDAGIDRNGTDCEKWDDREVVSENTVPMWVADMDFRCAPAIAEALSRRAAHACYGYTMIQPEDTQAMLDFIGRRHQVTGLRVEDTLMLPCVVTGLKLFVRCFTAPGERVAILTPVYGPFTASIELNGRTAVRVPLTRSGDDRYQIDFDQLEAVFQSGVRVLLMCSPHNPVGRCWTEEELNTLLSLTRRYHVRLCVDEIHAEFVYAPNRFRSILSLIEPEDEVVDLMSASKTFNIAGLQQAYALSANSAMLKAMRAEVKASGVFSGNIFALAGSRAAWTEGEAWLDGLVAYLADNLQLLSRLLKEHLPFARMSPVEATYLAWLDLRAYDGSCASMERKCKQAGVALTPGTFFGPEGEGFMRLNFGCPAAQLTEGVKRLKAAMRK